MKSVRHFLNRYSLVMGLALMFLFTWPIDLSNSGLLPFKVPFAVYIFVGWGFFFAAFIMTGLTLGRDGVITLLRRFLIWRVGWKWYLIAFLLFPIIAISSVLLNAAWTGSPIDFSMVLARQIFGPSAKLPLLIFPFFLFDAITNGEEIGWRGYVLPRLQTKYNALVSSLILGIIWGFWHLPKFLSPGNTGSFAWFLVKILVEAVLYTWLYNNTKGSLFLVTIFHAAGNTAGIFLPVATTLSRSNLNVLMIEIAIELLIAMIITTSAGVMNLSRLNPAQRQEI